jgi:hypothetical protein
MASSVWTKPVGLRTLGRIANPLQNRCFACIRSSDNEHSELDIWDSGGILLCSHSTKGSSEERLGKVTIRGWFPLGLLYHYHNPVKTSADCRTRRRNTSRIDPAYERVYSNPTATPPPSLNIREDSSLNINSSADEFEQRLQVPGRMLRPSDNPTSFQSSLPTRTRPERVKNA